MGLAWLAGPRPRARATTHTNTHTGTLSTFVIQLHELKLRTVSLYYTHFMFNSKK